MMLIEHNPVKAQLLGINPLIEIFMIELVAFGRVKAGVAHVGKAEVTVLVGNDVVLAHVEIRALRKSHYVHISSSCGRFRPKIVALVR